MQDPANGVPPQLLAHVHLLSTEQFAIRQTQLPADQYLSILIQAPKKLREEKPVAWQYLNAPREGSMFLAWQPLNHVGTTFASDGYLWAEPMKTFSQQLGDYSLEFICAESGFVPQGAQIATHRRVRARLVSAPGNFDMAIEVVHYMAAFPQHRLRLDAVNVSPKSRQELSQRHYLEQQGLLIRKEFMLQDSNNWPTIAMPGRPAGPAGMPANPYQQARPPYGPQGAYAGGAMGRPGVQPQGMYDPHAMRQGAMMAAQQATPGRRPRPSTGSRGPPVPAGTHQAIEEALLADEDNPSYGDALDLLSPRDISHARYKQHHDWMEEILLSPYAAGQIIPVDLGFHLAGQLGDITKGVFNTESSTTDDGLPSKITEEQVQELERRIVEFRTKGRDQIAAMKQEHATLVSEIEADNFYTVLERELAAAQPDSGKDGTVDEIVAKFEKIARVHVVKRPEVIEINKGGLLAQGEEVDDDVDIVGARLGDDDAPFENGNVVDLDTELTNDHLMGDSGGDSGAGDISDLIHEDLDAAVAAQEDTGDLHNGENGGEQGDADMNINAATDEAFASLDTAGAEMDMISDFAQDDGDPDSVAGDGGGAFDL